MKQTTKRFLSMVLGLVLIVASLMVYFQFISSAYDEIQLIKSQKIGRGLLLQNEQLAIEKVQNLISEYQSQGQIQEKISLSLPATEDVGGGLAQIYGIAKNSGLALQSASISLLGIRSQNSGAAAELGSGEKSASQFSLQKPIGSVVFNVRLTGSYDGLKDFLKLLETNIRIFDVGIISISPVGVSTGVPSGTFNYDVSITTYYQK